MSEFYFKKKEHVQMLHCPKLGRQLLSNLLELKHACRDVFLHFCSLHVVVQKGTQTNCHCVAMKIIVIIIIIIIIIIVKKKFY